MDDVIITALHAGDQSSALWHQMRDVSASSQKRSPDLPFDLWFVGGSSEHLTWSRWPWSAAPLRAGPPSDSRAAMGSGGGNTRTTCRLWQTPVWGMTGLSANTQRGNNSLYVHTVLWKSISPLPDLWIVFACLSHLNISDHSTYKENPSKNKMQFLHSDFIC